MKKQLIEGLLPLVYSSVGIGLIRSLFFGTLSRLFRKTIRWLLTLAILGFGGYFIYCFWL